MFSFLSNMLGAFSNFFDYLKQKRLADAVEGKIIAEVALEKEKARHDRTIAIHDIAEAVRNVPESQINKTSRRIEG